MTCPRRTPMVRRYNTMSKQFKKSKPCSTTASSPPSWNSGNRMNTNIQATQRWNTDFSPLKISFWAGSEDAPAEIKNQIRKAPETGRVEHCVLLSWRDALAVLSRADAQDFEFHPKDYDWQ